MDVLNCDLREEYPADTLSFTDLRRKLFPNKDKLDRSPVVSEERYSKRTLEGNWLEQRAVCVSLPNDWKTVYDTDYKLHVNEAWSENQIAKWDNKLNLEGLPQELLFEQNGKEYYNNMSSTYDLSYNILPKAPNGHRIRSYNTRLLRWIPEQDLTKSYGNLTQFGLKEMLKSEVYKNSKEGIAKCRWISTYREEIGQLVDNRSDDNKAANQFRKRRINFNVPDLKHLEEKVLDIQSCLFPFKIPSP